MLSMMKGAMPGLTQTGASNMMTAMPNSMGKQMPGMPGLA